MVTCEVFKGLGDPVRQAIVDLLGREVLNVSHLVEQFEISRPAISRHLRVLRESGVVTETRSGRERLYSIEAATLEAAADWLSEVARGVAGLDAPATVAPEGEARQGTDWRQW